LSDRHNCTSSRKKTYIDQQTDKECFAADNLRLQHIQRAHLWTMGDE